MARLTLHPVWEGRYGRDESVWWSRSLAGGRIVIGASLFSVPHSVGESDRWNWRAKISVDLCGLVALVDKPLRAASQGGTRGSSRPMTWFSLGRISFGRRFSKAGRLFLCVYRASLYEFSTCCSIGNGGDGKCRRLAAGLGRIARPSREEIGLGGKGKKSRLGNAAPISGAVHPVLASTYSEVSTWVWWAREIHSPVDRRYRIISAAPACVFRPGKVGWDDFIFHHRKPT